MLVKKKKETTRQSDTKGFRSEYASQAKRSKEINVLIAHFFLTLRDSGAKMLFTRSKD